MKYKYDRITSELRQKIQTGVYAANSPLPTENSLCKQYGVSRQTVRRALESLSEEGLIERRRGSGSYIRGLGNMHKSDSERVVAIVTTYISDYIFPSILREAEDVLSSNNCTTLIYATKNKVSNERRVLGNLLSLRTLDGVLVEGTKTALPNPNLDLYRELISRNIPLVFMNGNYRDLPEALSVLDDNAGGSRQLVEYLYNKGHRSIAGIFKSDDIQGHQRYAGYVSAMQRLGMPVDDDSVFWYSTETKADFYSGREFWKRLLETSFRNSTGIICYNDEIAAPLIQYLSQSEPQEGRSTPAVVSFDNSRLSELASSRITSLYHGGSNVGRIAAEMLIKTFNGESCKSQIVPWKIVEKESG